MAMVRILGPGQVDAVLKATDKKLRAAVKLAVLEAAAVGAEIVSRDAPVDTGRLKQSVVVRKRGPSGHPEIIARAPYAGPVEVGSRPHWVPLTPLVRWVRRHGAAFNLAKRRPSVGTTPARSAAAQKRRDRAVMRRAKYDRGVIATARAIQLAIAKRGTKPKWYMKRNLPRLRQVLMTLMRESKARGVAGLGSV